MRTNPPANTASKLPRIALMSDTKRSTENILKPGKQFIKSYDSLHSDTYSSKLITRRETDFSISSQGEIGERNFRSAYSEEALNSSKKGPSQGSVCSTSSKPPADLDQSLKHVNVKAAIQQRNAEIERATAEAKKIQLKANGLKGRNLDDSLSSSKSKVFESLMEMSESVSFRFTIEEVTQQRLRSLSASSTHSKITRIKSAKRSVSHKEISSLNNDGKSKDPNPPIQLWDGKQPNSNQKCNSKPLGDKSSSLLSTVPSATFKDPGDDHPRQIYVDSDYPKILNDSLVELLSIDSAKNKAEHRDEFGIVKVESELDPNKHSEGINLQKEKLDQANDNNLETQHYQASAADSPEIHHSQPHTTPEISKELSILSECPPDIKCPTLIANSMELPHIIFGLSNDIPKNIATYKSEGNFNLDNIPSKSTISRFSAPNSSKLKSPRLSKAKPDSINTNSRTDENWTLEAIKKNSVSSRFTYDEKNSQASSPTTPSTIPTCETDAEVLRSVLESEGCSAINEINPGTTTRKKRGKGLEGSSSLKIDNSACTIADGATQSAVETPSLIDYTKHIPALYSETLSTVLLAISDIEEGGTPLQRKCIEVLKEVTINELGLLIDREVPCKSGNFINNFKKKGKTASTLKKIVTKGKKKGLKLDSQLDALNFTPSGSSSQNALSDGTSPSVANLYNYSYNLVQVSVIPENTESVISLTLPHTLVQSFEYLEKNALDIQGLFRVSGGVRRIEELKRKFETNQEFNIEDIAQPHDVSTLIKCFFRELKDPLIPVKMFSLFVSLSDVKEMPVKLKILQMMLMLLPYQNIQTLYFLLNFLSKVARRSSVNQMTASNLATCFGPNIIRKSEAKDRSGIGLEKTVTLPTSISTSYKPRGLKHSTSSQNIAQPQPEIPQLAKRRSIFSLGKGSSDKLSSPNRSTEKIAMGQVPDKDAKSVIATNSKIVDVLTFLIEHFFEIWEIPESVKYKFQREMNMVVRTNPELEEEDESGRRRSL